MDLSTALSALRRGWIYPVIGLLAALAVAAGIHRMQTPMYASEGTYLVVPSPSDPDIVENIKTLDSTRSRTLLTTLTEIMESDSVLAEALTILGINGDAGAQVEAAVLPEANGVTLTATMGSAAEARILADTVAQVASQRFVTLYRIYQITVLDAPATPEGPAGPGIFDLLGVAGVLGLALGGGIALLRGPEGTTRRAPMSRRIDAYGTNVTPLTEHERYQRAG